MNKLVLQMKNIFKNYGGVQALEDVSLDLYEGEVLCLLGENGAGKSTLMKILTGSERPSAGEIYLHGQKVTIDSPIKAYRMGISIVHQELVQIPMMSISENIYAGRYPKKMGRIDYRALRRKTEALMDRLNIHFEPDSLVSHYSVAHRQLIEIMKALSYQSRIIVFDEPTAALTNDECEILFEIITQLKQEGISVIYISHRMADLERVGDRVQVLRDGQMSGEAPLAELALNDIIRMMVGREITQQFPEKSNRPGDVILEVKHLDNERINDISFELRRGEVLGFGGLIGAGRTELLRAIMGIDESSGELLLEGRRVVNKGPRSAIRNSFSMVPEDRKDHGLILTHSILQNIELSILGKLSRGGLMIGSRERAVAQEYVDKLRIRTPGYQMPAGSLSGGNQQKVVLAKCLSSDPQILLLDEPTRGVDVGAKTEIYAIINELASTGVSIIMVSSELPELLGVCDRIMVMHEGSLTGVLDAQEATEESIMQLAVK